MPRKGLCQSRGRQTLKFYWAMLIIWENRSRHCLFLVDCTHSSLKEQFKDPRVGLGSLCCCSGATMLGSQGGAPGFSLDAPVSPVPPKELVDQPPRLDWMILEIFSHWNGSVRAAPAWLPSARAVIPSSFSPWAVRLWDVNLNWFFFSFYFLKLPSAIYKWLQRCWRKLIC